MLRSMTGYGCARAETGEREITVEIRAVNQRYFEAAVRLPRAYLSLEDRIRGELRSRIARGKVEVTVMVGASCGTDRCVQVNQELLSRYLTALRAAAEAEGLRDDLSASSLLRFPEVVSLTVPEPDPEAVWAELCPVLVQALDAFLAQREEEGARLKADIEDKCVQIESGLQAAEVRLPQLLEDYRLRLEEKVRVLLEDRQMDEGRILTEVAIFADRIAVDEEIVRIRSHVVALRDLLNSDGAEGKKMDFIIQELNREVNTMTSKISDLEVTRIALELKSIIEKIREQVQNIE